MFDTRWAKPDVWREQERLPGHNKATLAREQVNKVLHLRWQEHCVECAFPDCYTTCSLYAKRADQNCARFAYGIYPNPDFSGHFNFGADILFRRWGKLEAALDTTSLAIPVLPHKTLEVAARLPLGVQRRLANLIPERTKALDFDEFVVELHSSSPAPFNLILTYDVYESGIRKTRCREAFEVHGGHNYFSVAFDRFWLKQPVGYVRLFPEDIAGETRLIFTWLDFVKFKRGRAPTPIATRSNPSTAPAAKVKCVAWDLDNTLWDGTLVEMEERDSLQLRPGVYDTIRALDERGIIQTIASKNDHSAAWPQLERLRVAEYFVHPGINWGQKSHSLKQIAERINIGLDTFALLDDSAPQRSEVQRALPQVRVYPETSIPTLCELPEFDVPITSASKKRRLSYVASMRREEVFAGFEGSYEEFLRSCEMEIRIFRPQESAEVLRCWELMQRTNQLNLSGRRYSLEGFNELLNDERVRGFGIEYKDKFGKYGIVGFGSLERSPEAILTDFVLSCRVAQQRVEHSFLLWLAARLRESGANTLRAVIKKTERNGAIRKVFSDLSFDVIVESDEVSDLALDLTQPREGPRLAKITTDITKVS